MKKMIWITWEKQRRNIGISSGVGAELFELISKKQGLSRYFELSLKTFSIIRKFKPVVVFAQNPSIVLSFLVVILQHVFHNKVVIDAHNSGIFPFDSRYVLFNKLSEWLQKSAYRTIVTNDNLRLHVDSNGGKGIVLPDRLPVPPTCTNDPLDSKMTIVFICSFSADEPYLEVIKAAEKLDNNYKIYFTGNFKGKIDDKYLPSNVEMLGYLSEEKYWDALFGANVVMDLTTREDCLVCGAYEGLSIVKPLILSDTAVNREYFASGCEYVKPNSDSIRSGIFRIFADLEKHKKDISGLKNTLEKSWVENKDILLKELEP